MRRSNKNTKTEFGASDDVGSPTIGSARGSSGGQADAPQSISDQLEQILELCAPFGLKLVNEHEELGGEISASNAGSTPLALIKPQDHQVAGEQSRPTAYRTTPSREADISGDDLIAARKAIEEMKPRLRPSIDPSNPSHIETLRRQSEAFQYNNRAKNTLKTYKSAWSQWQKFAADAGFPVLPAKPDHVVMYLTKLVQFGAANNRPLKARTAELHLAAIGAAHRAENLHWDRHALAIKKVMEGIRRVHGTKQVGATPFTLADIKALVATCSLDIRSIRNKAIILTGYAGGFRASELVDMNIDNLEFREEGVLITLENGSKTDQDKKGQKVAILKGQYPATCPILALQAWLRAADLDKGHGPVFRSINRWETVQPDRISPDSIETAIKAHCAFAGLDPKLYSPHSLRAGHVTEARAHGATKHQVKNLTRHRTDIMIDHYDRQTDVWTRNSSGFLGL